MATCFASRAPRPLDGRPGDLALAGLQRERILDAMIALSSDAGASNVAVAAVVRRAGISRRTFYETFSDAHECLLAALDRSLARAQARVLPAYEAHTRWTERLNGGLTELLSMFDEDRQLARFLLVELQRSDPSVLRRRHHALDKAIDAVDAGRGESRPAAGHLSRLTAEGVVGAVLSILHARVTAPRPQAVLTLRNELMSLIALPYLGPAAARRELERLAPQPVSVQGTPPVVADSFKEAGMRLTYRTVRVLTAIVDNTGASNRLIADAADIRDQGQASKLLTRLERAGMIANNGLTAVKGASNSWELTDVGRRVVATIGVRADGYPYPQSSDSRPSGSPVSNAGQGGRS